MATQQYLCDHRRRVAIVASTLEPDGSPRLNGLDYLEVTDDQRVLRLFFIHPAPNLMPENVQIVGGVRVRNIQVTAIAPVDGNDQALAVTVNQWGDFSTYQLQLVTSPVDDTPPPGLTPPLDRQLVTIPFSFKVDCPSPFDCPQPPACPAPAYPQPHIDYLAKDYASFRQLMLDRLAITLPAWTERNPADIGVALVEVLAYAADHLSYYQDAAGTEAYLGTARLRSSVRRHGRFLNYRFHEGCNARTWIQLQTAVEGLEIPQGTTFLTRVVGQPVRLMPSSQAYQEALQQQPEGFEAMHPLRIFVGHGEIPFYTWSDENCCLPKGATRATLQDQESDRLHLRPGDVLVLEEARGTATGEPADADVSHRQAVRLVAVHPAATEDAEGNRTPGPLVVDPLTAQPVVEIRWHPLDALTFALCLSKEIEGELRTDMAVARGNMVLADHGRSPAAPALVPDSVPVGRRYRPRLEGPDLTFAVPFDPLSAVTQPASGMLSQDPRQALPVVTLTDEDGTPWRAFLDLLHTDRFEPGFVVEMDRDRRATLRFGDGVFGRQPEPLLRLTPHYRVGNGPVGNVGAEAVAHIVSAIAGVTAVSNRLPGVGGTAPEPLRQAQLDAPQAFRTQERAVTEADYALVAQRHPEVQQARATRRWTGSWYTYFVTVDRRGGLPVDRQFTEDFRSFLDTYRLAGYDLEVNGPLFVPLDIRASVCVQPGYFPADVAAALLETFSRHGFADGRRGFFHPDNFTFGQSVYLSQLIAAAMAVPGVQWIDLSDRPDQRHRFQRWGRAPNQELQTGEISFDRLEIARLDNDPNAPENGRIEFLMEGSR